MQAIDILFLYYIIKEMEVDLKVEGNALIFLAVLIFFSKLVSDLFTRINLPPVLGMILIGLIIGPTGFDLLTDAHDMEKLYFFAEIGVIILLFMAGMETDLQQMKKIGKNALLIAISGVIVPLILGYGVSYLFLHNQIESIMLGVVLTATSVSVTVMTLMDMKKLGTVEGTTIMGAAIIDDVIGIFVLTIVLALTQKGSGGNVWGSFLMILLYIGGASLVGIFVFPILLNLVDKLKSEKPVVTTALALLFLFAWAAQKAEIAAITGAYLAGVFVAQTRFKKRVEEGVNLIGQVVFVSLFFVFIGVKTQLRGGNIDWWFSLAYVAVAIVAKIIGAGGMARILGFDWKRSMRIGSGMIPRGEVALVVATLVSVSQGGSLDDKHFSSVVFMVIISAFVTPFLLKLFFKEKNEDKGRVLKKTS